MDPISINRPSRLLQNENTKLAHENQNLLKEVAKLREVNKTIENRWETTERDLKTAQREMKSLINEKDSNYNDLEEEYAKVQEQLDFMLKKATSSQNYASSRTSNSTGLNSSSRRAKTENLFNDDNLLSGVETEYPIWAATLKRADEKAHKVRDELRISESAHSKLEEKITQLESSLNNKTKPLQRQIEELEEEKAKLRLENTKLELVVRQKEREKDLFVDKLMTSQTKLESAEEEAKMLKTSLQRAEGTQKYSDSSLNRLKLKIDELQDENIRLIQAKNESLAQVERAQREARALKGLEYEFKNAARDRKEQTTQEEIKLREEVASLKGKVEELEAQLKEERSDLKNEKTQAQALAETKEKELEELERTNEELEEELRHLKVKLEENMNLNANYEKRVQELESKLTKSYLDIKESHDENEGLRANQTELENLKRQLKASQQEKEALEVRVLIAEDENNRLREDAGEEVADEERLRSNLKVAEYERMELLRDYKRVCIENEKVKGELEEILAAHKESLRELRDAKTVALKTELNPQPEKDEDQYLSDLVFLEDLTKKLTVAETEVAEGQKARERLAEQLDTAQTEKEKIQQSLLETEQRIETLQKENDELTLQLTTSQKDIETLREELDKKAINNEVLKGLLEDQKKNQWNRNNDTQSDRRLNSEGSYSSIISKHESKRRGINSGSVVSFYSPQTKSSALQYDQAWRDYLTVPKLEERSAGYEERRYGAQNWSTDLGRSFQLENKSKWDSGYLKYEGDDNKKKKYGSVSIAYDKKYSKF